MKATHSFEHDLWKFLKSNADHQNRRFVLAVSGGCDSMALLASFSKVISSDKLIVINIHHGDSEKSEQQKFRNESVNCVEEFCRSRNLLFKKYKIQQSNSSEQFYRDERYMFLREAKKELMADWIVTAHHQEDLLETRVLRLLRGTGGQGLVGLRSHDGDLLRPFLSTSKSEMKQYLLDLNIQWIEDPSNLVSDPFRNWIRLELLPMIHQRDPSLLMNLHRSLQIIAEEVEVDSLELKKMITAEGILRQDFIVQSLRHQEKLLALYLREKKGSQWSAGLLSEVRRCLDRRENNFEFSIGLLHWKVTSERIIIK